MCGAYSGIDLDRSVTFAPGLPDFYYKEDGDISLGCLIPLHQYSQEDFCGTELNMSPARMPFLYAFRYAVEQVTVYKY